MPFSYRRYARQATSKGTDLDSFRSRLSLNPDLAPKDVELGARVLAEIANEDAQTALIRAHAYVDSCLGHLIWECLGVRGALDKERISFTLKVSLAIALGIVPEDFGPPLKELNSLRNKIAHRVEANITEADEKRLFNRFSLEDRTCVKGDQNLRNQLSFIHGCLYGQLKRVRQNRLPEL